MWSNDAGRKSTRDDPTNQSHDRERRLQLLIRRLPRPLRAAGRWLRQPSARWVRIPAGLLLMLGGVFSVLPVLGLWMLPFGLLLLAEDVTLLRRATDPALAWAEQRRPHWLGLPHASQGQPSMSGKHTP